ncbi:MAG: hypothetical protein K2Y30_02055 [Flavobacteriaceae bacterium]|nr:hypothetical protein [Flavobacteriaceae bacterium]
MLNQSTEEKEFFDNQKTNGKPDDLAMLSDRELQEKQIRILREISQSNISIKNNVQFWFYATIICAAIAILILVSQ